MAYRRSDNVHYINHIHQRINGFKGFHTQLSRHLASRLFGRVIKADKLIPLNLLDAVDVYLAQVTGTQNSYFQHFSKISAKIVFLSFGLLYFRAAKQKFKVPELVEGPTLFIMSTILEDTYRAKGLRKLLVEQLRNKGITDETVLKAINEVPRHVFLDSSFVELAYQDQAFPIGSGQTISQPHTVAFQTQLLQVEQGMKILEIGTGSGYQACVLAAMGAKMFSIERQRNLYFKTKDILEHLPYRIKTFLGDGFEGLPTYAPFDRVIITAGAPNIPEALVAQMRTNGIMVIPKDNPDGEGQTMLRITKMEDGTLKQEAFGGFRFVPMLKDIGKD